MQTSQLLSAAALALALSFGSVAHAQACPTSGTRLTIDNWSLSGNDKLYLGQGQLGGAGTWYVTAVIWDAKNKRYTSRFLKNGNAYLTGGKLTANSFLCLGAGHDYLQVVTADTSLPGQNVLKPMNFNGYMLSVYAEAGASHLDGGPGRIWFMGSSDASCNYVVSYTGGYRPSETYIFGGPSNDFLAGGWSAADRSYGGDGNDTMFDRAGTSDWMYGNAGSDCLEDEDLRYSALSCGAGSDFVFGGTSSDGSCETATVCPATDDVDLICGFESLFPGS